MSLSICSVQREIRTLLCHAAARAVPEGCQVGEVRRTEPSMVFTAAWASDQSNASHTLETQRGLQGNTPATWDLGTTCVLRVQPLSESCLYIESFRTINTPRN